MRLQLKRRRTAFAATVLLVASVLGAALPASMAHAAPACQVTYIKAWDNGSGFGANLNITNTGDPITSWTLTFAFPGNQHADQGWSGTWSQSGANVTVQSMSWNGTLSTGQSTVIGFNGSYTGTNTDPTAFSLNGVACNGQQQQALVVTPAAISVPEGGMATYSVRLQSQPSANVTVTSTAGTGDANLTVVSGATLTFTTANWNVPQTVTIGASEDADTTNGTRPFLVASSGLASVTVNATEADNDSPQALVVTPTSLNVPEGGTAVVGVHLAAQPSANVTVTTTAGTGDADLTVSAGGTLTFTTANWSTNQNVTIAAVQDADSANGTRPFTVASAGLASVTVTATEVDDEAATNAYITEFTTQYDKLKNPANGYFSPEGIPYHSIETLMVEAPDHGHETTSEAFSFWLWLEAQYGRVTRNWTPFNNAWTTMETYIIPTSAGQPGGSATYNPNDPADYAPEMPQPSGYPVTLNSGVVAGQDPLANELQSTYGNRLMYGMHWLIDVDDIYGYGTGRGSSLSECGDNTKRVTYINTYQRGPQESVWETVPHPSCETERFGMPGDGYPPLFIAGSSSPQWRYTDAPDADARAIQAAYWAGRWATAQGNQSQIAATLTKAAKMGDYLRYAMYDKYFKNPGCTSTGCTPGTGKSSSSYLLTWYYAWGGDLANSWSWRIGSSSWHQGYQNPLAAWALSPAGPTSLRPQSPTASADWQTSVTRQLDSYLWLQSAEGGIAGGATNSWNGNYSAPPAGTPTFYGWAYDFQPVFHDPPSNRWFGFQAWSMERVAEYYYVTGDAKAKQILDKWVAWAVAHTTLGSGSTFTIPSDMDWTGQPSASYSGAAGGPAANPGLHVTVTKTGNDVGVAAAYARTLSYYAAKEGATSAGTSAKNTAKGLLDRMIALKAADPTGKGIVVSEQREDYNRFDDSRAAGNADGLFVPPSYSGTMPNGDPINSNSTFLSIRSFYQNDPAWPSVQSYLNGGPVPSFQYHRFWAQSDIAMAFADYGSLFPAG
jgi:Glycosyl hydrolase family 48/Cellulose binding domain